MVESYVEHSFDRMDYKVTRFLYRLLREENPEREMKEEEKRRRKVLLEWVWDVHQRDWYRWELTKIFVFVQLIDLNVSDHSRKSIERIDGIVLLNFEFHQLDQQMTMNLFKQNQSIISLGINLSWRTNPKKNDIIHWLQNLSIG